MLARFKLLLEKKVERREKDEKLFKNLIDQSSVICSSSSSLICNFVSG